MGHSNGGQGAWHLASRFPDRVLGGSRFPRAPPQHYSLAPLSGPSSLIHQVTGLCPPPHVAACLPHLSLTPSSRMNRSAHFIDPAARAILESSLTPDDNDLFLSNLVDTPVLAVHGSGLV
jgi:pimeloyl-ACP methyl ester carboxylesterase